jgi:hypothetical protein
MSPSTCPARRAAPAVAVVLSLAHATPGRGGPRPPACVGPATSGAHRQPAQRTPPTRQVRLSASAMRGTETSSAHTPRRACRRVPIAPHRGCRFSPHTAWRVLSHSLSRARPHSPWGSARSHARRGFSHPWRAAVRASICLEHAPRVAALLPPPAETRLSSCDHRRNNPDDRVQDDRVLLRPTSLAAQPDPPPSGGSLCRGSRPTRTTGDHLGGTTICPLSSSSTRHRSP